MRKHHNKLFYGKYSHKVVFKMPWARWLYPTTDQHLDTLLMSPNPYIWKGHFAPSTRASASKYQKEIRALCYIIKKFRHKMKFRIQEETTIIFTSKNLAHDLISAFWDEWIDCMETSTSFTMKMDKNTVVCSRLPHKKYQYQVWLKAGTYQAKSKLAKSLASYLLDKPDVGMPANKYQTWWLKGESDYDGQGYFYISDEKCLTPVHMILGESIDKIIKFVKI
jgi:hypothetical protein